MWEAIGDSLPLAIGLTLSPFAIVTGLVLLLGEGGRTKAAVFTLGRFIAILIVAFVATLFVEVADEANHNATEAGVDIVQLVVGVLFFALAVLTWVRRPRGDQPAKSKLLQRLDGLSAVGALGIGISQGFLVITNLTLAIGAGALFGEAGLKGGAAVVALVILGVVGSLSVLVPLIVVIATGPRLAPGLRSVREWIEANMAAITIVILLILGGYFLGQGLGILD